MSETGVRQKLKLLVLARLFEDETDEGHPITANELIDLLERQGISSNRKTLYDDIHLLEDFGMDIVAIRQGRGTCYYLASRDFELPELKLLADSVSASRFITEKKSRTLLKKLERLAGRFGGQELNRSVYIKNRVKSENELIYISVDTIQRAVTEKKQISFRYFDYDLKKRRKYREGIRVCSPYALTWSDGNYYLVAYYEKYPETLSNFRVDRMEGITLLDEDSVEIPENFDLPGYMNTSFSMFSGVDRNVKMRFDNSLVNAVIDKFGSDIIIVPAEDGSFTVSTEIKPGGTFYGWMFQFGDKAEILYPSDIRESFLNMAESVIKQYSGRTKGDNQ